MIDIQVSGGTKRQRELCKSIAEFSIAKLMPRKRNLDIDIQLNKTDGALGYCLWINRNEYSVEIDKRQGLRRFCETVAHEMVHVKQYSRGELFEIRPQRHRWKDAIVKGDVDYYDLPWEIEAHGREVGLFIRWCEASGFADCDWAQDIM